MSINKNQGFTLIEVMLGLSVIALIGTFLIQAYLQYQRGLEREGILAEHIKQYEILVNGSANYFNTNYSTIADDTSGFVSLNTLETGSFIPNEFGQQYESVHQDLLGLSLRVAYNKKPIEFNGVEDQTIRAIFTVDQAGSWNQYPENFVLNKFNVIDNQTLYDNMVSSWYHSLGSQSRKSDLVAGVIERNSFNVKGVNRAFNFVLNNTEFPIAQRAYDRIVFFWGWPDLNGFPGGVEPPGGGNPGTEYAACHVTERVYYQTVLQTDRCSGTNPGLKNLVDLYSDSPTSPSPFYSVPGFGAFYSYVSKEAITDLSSLGSNCSSTARSYCTARQGSPANFQYCGTSDAQRYSILTDACLSTPVYSIVNNASLGGGVYKANELYREGSYYFGQVSGTQYEVEVNSDLTYHNQYTFCCPLDVPDL